MTELKIDTSFREYLSERTAVATVERYEREIPLLLAYLKLKNTSAEETNYTTLLEYIGEKRKQYGFGSGLNGVLYPLKHYFAYLVAIGKREDNPARSIRLRDKRSKDIQLQDLFTSSELELLLNRKERYTLLKNRNLVITSLLIYQGLLRGELTSLRVSDVDLAKGTISVKGQGKTNARSLKLKANQVFWMMQYINTDRPKLLKEPTNKLIISQLGSVETGEGIGYVIETQRHLFPDRKLNPVTIRQSVITNLLKLGHDLRLVQAFAGHKYPSATEKYKQTEVEELKNQVLKFHPLK